MIIYHDDLRFHADEWTPLHALHISQKGTINLGFFLCSMSVTTFT